ncbi:MAG: hypothetical protein DWQ35_00335 [Planctomycetota bacterium]|nr:MAG: hypothetical protein DWQ35_00335 [Planctomycetota bacterium]
MGRALTPAAGQLELRRMVDALRLVLGLAPLYAAERPSELRVTVGPEAVALGNRWRDGRRRAPRN